MALNKNGMDLKAIRRDQKAIDALPNHGRASLKPYAKKMSGKVDYEKLSSIAQKKGYKRNLSSREISILKDKNS